MQSQAHGAEQLQTQAIQQAASKLIVSGCQNETVAGIVRGEYVATSENHGRPVFRRTEQSNNMDVLIYFWDDRDGASFSGWWFGPAVGGDQVWAYSPDKSMVPPSSQWRVPYDGAVDASFSVQVVGSQEQQAYQQMAQQNQQYQQAQQGYAQGCGPCGPCGQAGYQQNVGHQEWQEAQRRQQEEQNAVQMVRQAIHRVRTTSPEALDQACAEMQDVFNKIGSECGNMWQRLQQEVYQATQMAAERKETYRQQREEEEKRMKEREAVTAQLLQELSQLVVAAEGSVSELKEKVQPIMDTSLDLSELDKSSAGFDEVKGKAKASCRACSDFLLSKRFAMEEARSVVAETREQLVQLQRKIHGAFVNMATCVNGLEAKIDGAHRKEKALKYMEKREELFRKYDVDNDGMLNAQEIAAYAQGEYSFQVPQSVIDKLVGCGDDKKGVEKQNLARVRQAVGVAREEAAVKRRRVEAEKRRKELEAEKEALEANTGDVAWQGLEMSLVWIVALLWRCCAKEWPVYADMHEIAGLQAFSNWPASANTVFVLFHGCNNGGSEWFQKPEEVIFLRAVLARSAAILAFTNPVHDGSFCWPNSDGSDFEDVAAAILNGARRIFQSKTTIPLDLIFVGASSGGTFALDAQPIACCLGYANEHLLVRTPSPEVEDSHGEGSDHKTGRSWARWWLFFRWNSKLVGHPRSDFPATGIIYMPRDVSFASEAAVAQLLLSLKRMNVAAKAWPVGPRKLTASDFLRSLNEASVSRFIEALTDLGLVEAEEVVADPRRFPWQRTLVALRER
eukprot:s3850_g4.t1